MANPRPTYDPQTLLNAQPVMVAVIDPASYTIQFQNETGLGKLGDLSGKTCYESIAGCPSPCSFCKMPEAVHTGQVTVNEVELPNKQHLLVQWSKAVTEDGRLHVIETITDVTEQRRLEDAARHAEKMDALSRLAGGMAHDLNNLLTVVIGASEQVCSETRQEGPELAQIQRLRSAVGRAAELTRRLVAFSHHQVLQQSFMDMNRVVEELMPRVRDQAGTQISVEVQLHEGTMLILADPHQLHQLMMVLVSNACEAMPNGGALTFITDSVSIRDPIARGHSVKAGEFVRLIVRDSGCGISPETLDHLFEPFYRRNGECTGRGLGLASVYGIVRQSGGFIEVTSGRGTGTNFTVHFPRAEHTARAPFAATAVSAAVGQPMILLVEDDQDVRLAVGDMLKVAGYRVEEACDGMDALERLRSMSPPPQLVLTDVMMPRMTGPQLAVHLETIGPGTQVLYMSGYSDQVLPSADGRQPAFIAKPFSGKELIRAVRQLLAG